MTRKKITGQAQEQAGDLSQQKKITHLNIGQLRVSSLRNRK